MKSLKTSTATGPDGIPAIVLKNAADVLAVPCASLFSNFFNASFLPLLWRTAQIVPVFKSRKKSDPLNYRPISLLCILSKVMERIVADAIKSHLACTALLSPFQFGFRSQHSSLHPILILAHEGHKALESSLAMHVVSLDIKSAFLKVWHEGLLSKCYSFGIRDPLRSWLRSYLKDRKQFVVVDGFSSHTVPIYSGVPQGSVLGPLLFLLFINDLSNSLRSRFFFFADDITLYSTSKATIDDDLQLVSSWADQWQVTFSPVKTQYIIFRRKHHPFISSSITFCNTTVHASQSLKLLGFHLTDDLSWKNHLLGKLRTAAFRFSAVRRAGRKLSLQSKLHLFKRAIRPFIEYGSPVISPISSKVVACLERFQRRCVSFGPKLLGSPIDSLSHRRSVASLQILHNIIHGRVPNPVSSTFHLIPRSFPRLTRSAAASHPLLFTIPTASKSSKSFCSSFFPSSLRLWNALPTEIKTVSSPKCFRIAANAWLRNNPEVY